jgi:tetratricopeptide (TPR) repeat protein
MISLAFVNWLHEEGEETLLDKAKEVGHKLEKGNDADNREVYALVFIGFIALVVMYNCNIKPIQMLVGTIDAHAAYQQGLTEKSYETFKKALSIDTVLDRDAASVFVRLIASDITRLESLNKNKAQEILDYAISEAEDVVAYNPKDSMNQLILAQILDAAARFNKDNPEKFAYYYNRALEATEKSIASSPDRATNYFFKAQLLSTTGDKEGAIEALKYAWSLNQNFSQSNCHLAKFLIYYDRAEEAYPYMDACIDLNGLRTLSPDLVRRVANHYIEAGDLVRTEKIIIALTKLEKGNLENWINLIKLYGQMGDKEKAREAADQAIEIDYGIKQYAEQYVDSIE